MIFIIVGSRWRNSCQFILVMDFYLKRLSVWYNNQYQNQSYDINWRFKETQERGFLIGFQDLNLFWTPKCKQHKGNNDNNTYILSWFAIN